jgi:hypothetical protein
LDFEIFVGSKPSIGDIAAAIAELERKTPKHVDKKSVFDLIVFNIDNSPISRDKILPAYL